MNNFDARLISPEAKNKYSTIENTDEENQFKTVQEELVAELENLVQSNKKQKEEWETKFKNMKSELYSNIFIIVLSISALIMLIITPIIFISSCITTFIANYDSAVTTEQSEFILVFISYFMFIVMLLVPLYLMHYTFNKLLNKTNK